MTHFKSTNSNYFVVFVTGFSHLSQFIVVCENSSITEFLFINLCISFHVLVCQLKDRGDTIKNIRLCSLIDIKGYILLSVRGVVYQHCRS